MPDTTDSLCHYRQVVVMMYGQTLAESSGQQTLTETPPPSWREHAAMTRHGPGFTTSEFTALLFCKMIK